MPRKAMLAAVLVTTLGLADPALAQREGLGMGEGFMAKIVGTAQEHPVAVGTGAAASAAAIVALIRELRKRQ